MKPYCLQKASSAEALLNFSCIKAAPSDTQAMEQTAWLSLPKQRIMRILLLLLAAIFSINIYAKNHIISDSDGLVFEYSIRGPDIFLDNKGYHVVSATYDGDYGCVYHLPSFIKERCYPKKTKRTRILPDDKWDDGIKKLIEPVARPGVFFESKEYCIKKFSCSSPRFYDLGQFIFEKYPDAFIEAESHGSFTLAQLDGERIKKKPLFVISFDGEKIYDCEFLNKKHHSLVLDTVWAYGDAKTVYIYAYFLDVVNFIDIKMNKGNKSFFINLADKNIIDKFCQVRKSNGR